MVDDPITFVGRRDELQSLKRAVQGAVADKGSLIFVAGHAGMGKSLLLDRFAALVRADPDLSDVRFATGSSYEMTGPQDALQPFREALLDLPAGDEGKRWAKAVVGVLRDVGPDLLQLVPGLGAGLALGAKAAVKATSSFSLSDESHGSTRPLLAEQLVTSLVEISRREAPLAVVVEDAHWIDRVSAEMLVRLAESVSNSPLVVVVTYRPAGVVGDHPLAAALRGALGRGTEKPIELAGLSVEEVEAYLQQRFDSSPHPLLAEWLREHSDGHPLFITQYISLLEDAGVIRRAGAEYVLEGSLERTADGWVLGGPVAAEAEALSDQLTSDQRVEAVLESRVARLDAEQQLLLKIAAVQGRRFWSQVVTQGPADDELQVLERLREVATRHQVIREYLGDSWAARTSDVYEFEHVLLQRAFYRKLTGQQARIYHHKVAVTMAELVDADPDPPRQVILELARHSELAGSLANAARRYLTAAESLFEQGAFSQAVVIGSRGLENARAVAQPEAADKRVLARLVATVLVASELRWSEAASPQSEVPIDALLVEGTTAATEVEDHGTLARLEYSRAKLALQRHRLPLAIASLRDALTHAEQAEDQIAQIMVLSSLGHHLASENLQKGLETLRTAQRLVESGAITARTRAETRALQRQRALLDGHQGIGEFDAGEFGTAEELLVRANRALRKLGMTEHLPINLGFLAQEQTATGQFEAAESTLTEALAVLDESPGHGHAGYTRSLWIKLLIECQHAAEAKLAIELAWRETEQSGHADVVPLVRNVLAEALMLGEPSSDDLAAAQRHLEASIAESQAFAAARGEVTARTLLARLLRSKDQASAALNEADTAVGIFKSAGSAMPAVRGEEVFFECALAARDVGEPSKYREMVQASHAVLTKKADSIPDPGIRATFLKAVPLSAAITEASQTINPRI